ncbi:putative reactive intermediate deaminase TdcF [compost metagenome]|jgi:2-iminobutanoate/2-iminopropanoate deaminase
MLKSILNNIILGGVRMKKEIISTSKAPGAIGPYSQGVKIGNLVYTSGQIPLNPIDGSMPSSIEDQTKQSLENCKAILEEAGTSLDNVIKTTVFLADMNDFVKMNEVYSTYFSANPPARSAVQVAKLPKDAQIEIEMIATI